MRFAMMNLMHLRIPQNLRIVSFTGNILKIPSPQQSLLGPVLSRWGYGFLDGFLSNRAPLAREFGVRGSSAVKDEHTNTIAFLDRIFKFIFLLQSSQSVVNC